MRGHIEAIWQRAVKCVVYDCNGEDHRVTCMIDDDDAAQFSPSPAPNLFNWLHIGPIGPMTSNRL